MAVQLISPLCLDEVCKYTAADSTQQHLPVPFEKDQPFFGFPDELTVGNDNMLKRNRAVIPKSLHYTVLHTVHWGVEATKEGQENVFWPSISDDIVQVSGVCRSKMLHQPNSSWKFTHFLTCAILCFFIHTYQSKGFLKSCAVITALNTQDKAEDTPKEEPYRQDVDLIQPTCFSQCLHANMADSLTVIQWLDSHLLRILHL